MYQTSAMAVGVLISFMLLANGALQAAFGPALAMLILHATGTIALIVILWIKRASFAMTESVPLYLYSAGAFGVLLVLLNNRTVATIGLSLTIALGVVGQLIVSSLVDHFGLFGLERRSWNARKMAGLLLIAAGIVVMAGPGGLE